MKIMEEKQGIVARPNLDRSILLGILSDYKMFTLFGAFFIFVTILNITASFFEAPLNSWLFIMLGASYFTIIIILAINYWPTISVIKAKKIISPDKIMVSDKNFLPISRVEARKIAKANKNLNASKAKSRWVIIPEKESENMRHLDYMKLGDNYRMVLVNLY
jgi:hypothetical protein